VTGLDFLTTDLAETRDGLEPRRVSPLGHALPTAKLGLEDISLSTGKIEVRGSVESIDSAAEVFRITPERALVLCDYERVGQIRSDLEAEFETVVDVTGALAGLRIERPDAEQLLRRLTELDLTDLPAVGGVARIPVHVFRDGEAAFRLFFPQEYGDYFVEVVLDAAEGLS
jgi:heterotetrameric sarcosine oxidase gamma subunit